MPSSIYRTTNTLAWLKECRQHNKNAMKNTATGEWLRVACLIIEEQFSTIQGIRNEQIDKTTADILTEGMPPDDAKAIKEFYRKAGNKDHYDGY